MAVMGNKNPRKRNKEQKKETYRQDKAFNRSLAAIMKGEVVASEDAQEFVQKYNSGSNKVKSQLRDMWHLVGQDFDQAGLQVKAQRKAFAEQNTTGTYLSEEQLKDEFKSEQHTQSYMRYCEQHRLVKWDPKRQCRVYFYEKKLFHHGSRDEGMIEKVTEARCEDDMALSDEEGENSSSTDSESSQPKKKKKKKKNKKNEDSDSDAPAAKKKEKGQERQKG